MATSCYPALVRKSFLNSRGTASGIYNSSRPRPQFHNHAQKRCLSVVPGNFNHRSIRRFTLPFHSHISETNPSHSSTTIPLQTASPPVHDSNPQTPRQSQRSRTLRFFSATALVLVFGTLGFSMAAAPAVDTLNGVLAPPTDAETLTLYQPTTGKAAQINEAIVNSTLAQRMREKGDFVECRPHLKIPEAMRSHNLTGGTLLGDDKIAVPPLVFLNDSETTPSLVQISYLGQSLCGHPGIIHGGLLATLLDEGLARACFPALPNKVGVTASLTINYRKPCPADAFIVLRAETTKAEGRKAWVRGWIELMTEDGSEGERLVEAEALFIEPRGAKNMARIYSPSK